MSRAPYKLLVLDVSADITARTMLSSGRVPINVVAGQNVPRQD